MTMMSDPSSQIFTFLFTDLEGSTQLWEQYPEAMQGALERHDAILRKAVESFNGQVVKTTGDGLMAVFASTLDGLSACLDAQQKLLDESWGETGPLRVRMGLHVGEAQPRAGDYYGPAVNRAARIMAVAHGGQVLLSAPATILVVDQLPDEASLLDLHEHRLKDLERSERLYQLTHPDLIAEFPPLASLNLRPNNLPTLTSAFIGRDGELSEIKSRLDSDTIRLLTLTGPGGTGKTRLALQSAADLIDHFEDGVYFVDLAPVRDPDAVFATIGRTIGLKEQGDLPPVDDLSNQLGDQKMLLLLDNFEQVTDAAPAIVVLLHACPHLKMLITSREALHVRGEYLFAVPPLGLPKVNLEQSSVDQLLQFEAVRLFVERAQAVRSDFMLTEENAAAVAEVCLRLDGLPLAIELAAARVRVFSPQKLQARLESRLKLLRGGARDLPLRQQTLRSTIEWSYELLDEGERRLFALLSIFSSSTFEAVEAVTGRIKIFDDVGLDAFDGLLSLVDKSLIRQIEPDGGESRLLMLETIREYACERLEEEPAFCIEAQRAHASYFADFAQEKWLRLAGNDRKPALTEMASEAENLQTAWQYWVGESDLEQLNKLVDSVWRLYDSRGWYLATVDLTTDLLNVLSFTPSTPQRVQQEILLQIGLARALLAIKGFTVDAEDAYIRALELSEAEGEVPQLFPVLRGLATYYNYRAEFDKGADIGEKILHLAESLDDDNMRVTGYLVLGTNTAFMNQIKLGLSHIEKGKRIYNSGQHRSGRFQLGNDPGVVCYTSSAFFLWVLGYPEKAMERTMDGLALAQRLDHPLTKAYALYHTGFLHLMLREAAKVRELAGAALAIAEEHDFKIWKALATCLDGAAMTVLNQGEDGLTQFRRGKALYKGLKTPPVFWPSLLLLEARICAMTGRAEEGFILIDEIVDLMGDPPVGSVGIDILMLKGDLLLFQSPANVTDAEAHYHQALELTKSYEARMLELQAVTRLSRVWLAQGKADQATKLLGEVYQSFTEGFATAELIEARALLDEFS